MSLPNWIRENLPEIEESETIGYDSKREIFWKERTDGVVESFSTLKDACHCNNFNTNIKFDESLNDVVSLKNNGCTVFDKSLGRVFQAKTDSERFTEFEQLWDDLNENIARLKRDNSDWRSAFKIINKHPFMWVPLSPVPTFSWIVDGGIDSVVSYLSDSDNEDKLFINVVYDEGSVETSGNSLNEAYCNLALDLIEKLENINDVDSKNIVSENVR